MIRLVLTLIVALARVLSRSRLELSLVTPEDLDSWLRGLEPNIEICLAGSDRRKKLSPSKDSDYVLVRNPGALP